MFSAMEDSLKAIAWLENFAQLRGVEISDLGLLGSAGAVTSLNIAYGLNDYGFDVPEFKVVVNHWGNLLIDQESSKPSITADEAALISVHGTEDPIVLYSGSFEIHTRADEIGLTAELITSEGAGHGFNQNRLWDSESFEGSGYTKGERILNFVNAAMLTPTEPPEEVNADNYNVLYIGHSFGRPFAQSLKHLPTTLVLKTTPVTSNSAVVPLVRLMRCGPTMNTVRTSRPTWIRVKLMS